MTDFVYTEKTDPVKSGSRPSQVIECLYYNDKTKELLVGVVDTNNAYIYEGVPRHVYVAFVGAVSKGYFWNKIVKKQYGPADDAGWTDEVNFIEYGSQATATAGTPKALNDNTGANVLLFPLKAEPEAAPVKVKTEASEPVFKDAKSADVKFNLGGRDAVTTFTGTQTVSAAVAEITQIAETLGLGEALVIKAVTINFE